MKESNLQHRRIQNYKNGRDALMESEKIKKKSLKKNTVCGNTRLQNAF